MRIVLIGMKASGKTTIGRQLANASDLPFVDTDAALERLFCHKVGHFLSARQIYKKLGNKAFRRWEEEAIRRISPMEEAVIASGGGSMMDPGNRGLLRANARWIFLDVGLDVLWARIQQDGLPPYLSGDDPFRAFETLYDERVKRYREIADVTIDAERSIDQVVRDINNYILDYSKVSINE